MLRCARFSALFLLAAFAPSAPAASVLSTMTAGPPAARPSWLLSPEELESTARDTWGLTISDAEAQTFFASVHTLMGGTSVVRRTTLLKDPHELYVLTLDSLASWLADKLMQKQQSVEQNTQKADLFAFGGLVIGGGNASDQIKDPAQCQSCYQDPGKSWCDCADGITIGALQAAGLTPASLAPGGINAAWRKRLMHNIQDIGDFLMCGVGSVDNLTPVSWQGQTTHLAAYLLDDVFLPTWAALQDASANGERKAWAAVIHSILMGQACFLDLTSAAR